MSRSSLSSESLARHMIAEAMLVSHYVAAAVEAGAGRGEINAVLAGIADRSAISEVWVTDETGKVEFTTVEGAEFHFPTDTEAGTQAAPFAALLDGTETVVDQDFRARELDGALFK